MLKSYFFSSLSSSSSSSLVLLITLLFFTSCLRTRADVAGQEQEYLFGQANAQNQIESQTAQVSSPSATEPVSPAPAVVVAAPTTNPETPVDKDELIRELNGRVEVLENQVTGLMGAQQQLQSEEAQKIVLLQEALAKMELQIQRLESELPINKTTEQVSSDLTESQNTDLQIETKKLNPYEAAQQYFAKQEWKKAILSYQKYVDETPKGKNVADSKYKIGVCFQELGMKEEAMAFYEEVVANYGKTEAGKKSKSRLTQLKK